MKLLPAVGCLLGISATTAFQKCDISEYGPYGDGINYDDDALQQALNDCHDGGQIFFKSGKYLLSPFNLSSDMELYLDEGATLLATSDFDKWPIVEELPSYPPQYGGLRVGAFIGSYNSSNVTIRGKGTIDGQGESWWNAESGVLKYGRGRLIEPMYCTNFKIDGIKVINPPFWAIHPYACDGVDVENVIFQAPITSPNTDGIDPDSCTNVRIINFTASCGDDAIAIKSGKDEYGRLFNRPSSNILIQGGWIGPSSGIDIGSEMSGNVFNVTIRGTHFQGALFALRIKSGRGRGGLVRDITVEDAILEDMVMGLAITMHYADGEPAPPNDETTPHIENVFYRNITGSALDAGAFLCLPESACRGITLHDVNIKSVGGFLCERAFGTTDETVSPDACVGK